MATQEKSAGVVVFRAGPPREYLLLDYGRHWDYPKGHIEPGETALEAAMRELTEETGISGARVVPGFAREIRYFFRDKKKGGLISKSVIFYLAEIDTDQVTLSHEHVGYAFALYAQGAKQLTFATARQVLREAEEFLNRGNAV